MPNLSVVRKRIAKIMACETKRDQANLVLAAIGILIAAGALGLEIMDRLP